MTQAELKGQLIANPPQAAVGYIIENNPEAVAENLRGLGFVVTGPKGIEDGLNALLDAGRTREFVQALSVPFLTADVDPNEVAAVRDAVLAMNAASGRRQSVDPAALFGGLATGILAYIQATQTAGKPPGTGTTPTTSTNTPPKQDRTMLYIGIGVGLIGLVLLIAFLIKRQG